MPRVCLGLCLGLLIVAGLLVPTPALAQRPGDLCDSATDPRRLVEEGLRLYKAAFAQVQPQAARQRYEAALRCYDRAIERSQSPGKIFHPLGLVYEKLDRPEDALEAYQRFLAEVPEAERSPQVSQKLRERVDALRAQLAARRPPELAPPPTAAAAPAPAPVAPPAPAPVVGAPRREPRTGLIIAGASIFGGAYLIGIIGGAVCSADGYICGPQGWGWYVPLIGPFIAMGSYQKANDDYAAVEAVLAVDGLLQIGGVTMAILGGVLKRPVPRVSALPVAGGAGLAWSGTF
jgi:tetratricopeptide (TPR) repeat protein